MCQHNSETAKQEDPDFSQSVLQSVSTSVSQYFSQSVLTSISQSAFLNKTPCGPFFFIRFVPDVGFGNWRFAFSHWPANKWERDVIFDPFLSPRNIICFGTQQAVFSVTRNRFRNRKQLARKGVENSSEVVVFYRAPHVPRPDFNRRRVSGTLRSKIGTLEGIIASYGQKKWSRLSKAAPTNGGILSFDSRMKTHRFSDCNHEI